MLVEMAVATAIIGIIAVVIGGVIFQIGRTTELENTHINAIRQAQNAGDWISRDAKKAQSITTDGLEYPDFLVLSWTQRDYVQGESTYNVVTYSFVDVSNNIGKLKRNYWNSIGANQNALISSYIYYNAADAEHTSKANYLNPKLEVQLAICLGNYTETRQYIVERRPTFEY